MSTQRHTITATVGSFHIDQLGRVIEAVSEQVKGECTGCIYNDPLGISGGKCKLVERAPDVVGCGTNNLIFVEVTHE